MGFRKAKEGDPRVNSEVQIFVENLPKTVTVPELNTFFEKAGKVKKDRDTRQPRVWLYHDKTTNEPTGECTITYYNHESQVKALKEFNQAMFQGQTITVTPSIVKFHMARVPPRRAKKPHVAEVAVWAIEAEASPEVMEVVILQHQELVALEHEDSLVIEDGAVLKLPRECEVGVKTLKLQGETWSEISLEIPDPRIVANLHDPNLIGVINPIKVSVFL
jgi:RNA-binding proteins (RRM domain)